ncbi:copper resistance CopC/CopD family protein [Bradyrhizobium japonicum]|uniref:copper resistance CopC/CopD family protein n=1 Tax=Bradyrhizobium japonicum TaxID=375 RepID=UPI0020A1B740|nr:CopD family protein [Bradyrhizobium japonicum]MCP1765627.1 copper transport protein [Bradyrhizobium japonicum]MCP1787764.1 copper transport protein [Bradyrhizobium japonicum]MCP1809640.1 copper transport protein [Bradyrhizobium japonicum]MCP1818574.1 copper transport protein [Bradyrhizobium japonicum]MCP1869916.1 copper transport protein [Bradyrhizobium japonicum]
MRLLAALATLLCVVGFATGASAHAALVAVEPASGSMLASAPKAVELRFNEAVTPGAIQLIDGAGRARDDARVSTSGETISVAMPPDLPQGTAVVSYRVISQDGYPVAGSMIFSIGMPTGTQPPANADRGLKLLIWLARVGLYLGLFVGVGGVFFARWVAWSTTGMTVPRVALAIGIPSATASVGALGLDLLGLPPAALATAAPWKVAFATSAGPALLVAIAAMLLALMALRSAWYARALAIIALVGVGLSLAMTGHAATAPPEALTRPAIFLHGLGVTIWIGALAPLVALVSKPTTATLPVVNRFSRIAALAVGVLALTGLALAIVQLEKPVALVETRYGVILSIKLALVTGLLALAALNRFRLTPALARDESGTPALKRSILLEGAIALAILAVVASWRFTPPPRTIIPETPLAIHIHSDKAMFQVLVSPGKPGVDDFVLQLMTGEATPLIAKEVTLTLSLPERGIEPMERGASLGPDGYWHVRKVELPFAGRWHVRIDALVTDFEKVTLEDELDLGLP